MDGAGIKTLSQRNWDRVAFPPLEKKMARKVKNKPKRVVGQRMATDLRLRGQNDKS